MTKPCQFGLVVVWINEGPPKGRKKIWTSIKDAKHLVGLFASLLEAAVNLPRGAKGPEIIQEASSPTILREQLEVAWVVVDTLLTKDIAITQVEKVDAWQIVNSPGKLVICVTRNKTRAKRRRRRAKRRAGSN